MVRYFRASHYIIASAERIVRSLGQQASVFSLIREPKAVLDSEPPHA
jgi:protein-disulfide isomerase-like protein with CxxC motif